MPRPPTPRDVRRRRLIALAVVVSVITVAVIVLASGGGGPERLVPGGGLESGTYDPLGYESSKEDDLARRAAAGFSDVVYEKSPGGVVATAKRVAHWRPLVERAAKVNGVDPGTLEALVFLESAGRADAIAGGNVEGAAGLTQILASTATALLHMKVDLARSRSLTTRIDEATTDKQARKLERARRRADDRFDPAKSITGAAIYLAQAKKRFGRDDMAVATYHMGMGNLETALSRYKAEGGDGDPSYARLYFDSAPLRRPRTYAFLSGLGDDSSTYLWRIRAAQDIMRLYRSDPAELRKLAALDRDGGAGERRLFPGGPPDTNTAKRTAPLYPPALGLHLTGPAQSDFAPDPPTESVLAYIGAGVKAISKTAPLTVTSAHGIRIEISRRYRDHRQALAFQYMLDRLQAWNLIAWGRLPRTIAIVVAPDAVKVLGAASQLERNAARKR